MICETAVEWTAVFGLLDDRAIARARAGLAPSRLA